MTKPQAPATRPVAIKNAFGRLRIFLVKAFNDVPSDKLQYLYNETTFECMLQIFGRKFTFTPPEAMLEHIRLVVAGRPPGEFAKHVERLAKEGVSRAALCRHILTGTILPQISDMSEALVTMAREFEVMTSLQPLVLNKSSPQPATGNKIPPVQAAKAVGNATQNSIFPGQSIRTLPSFAHKPKENGATSGLPKEAALVSGSTSVQSATANLIVTASGVSQPSAQAPDAVPKVSRQAMLGKAPPAASVTQSGGTMRPTGVAKVTGLAFAPSDASKLPTNATQAAVMAGPTNGPGAPLQAAPKSNQSQDSSHHGQAPVPGTSHTTTPPTIIAPIPPPNLQDGHKLATKVQEPAIKRNTERLRQITGAAVIRKEHQSIPTGVTPTVKLQQTNAHASITAGLTQQGVAGNSKATEKATAKPLIGDEEAMEKQNAPIKPQVSKDAREEARGSGQRPGPKNAGSPSLPERPCLPSVSHGTHPVMQEHASQSTSVPGATIIKIDAKAIHGGPRFADISHKDSHSAWNMMLKTTAPTTALIRLGLFSKVYFGYHRIPGMYDPLLHFRIVPNGCCSLVIAKHTHLEYSLLAPAQASSRYIQEELAKEAIKAGCFTKFMTVQMPKGKTKPIILQVIKVYSDLSTLLPLHRDVSSKTASEKPEATYSKNNALVEPQVGQQSSSFVPQTVYAKESLLSQTERDSFASSLPRRQSNSTTPLPGQSTPQVTQLVQPKATVGDNHAGQTSENAVPVSLADTASAVQSQAHAQDPGHANQKEEPTSTIVAITGTTHVEDDKAGSQQKSQEKMAALKKWLQDIPPSKADWASLSSENHKEVASYQHLESNDQRPLDLAGLPSAQLDPTLSKTVSTEPTTLTYLPQASGTAAENARSRDRRSGLQTGNRKSSGQEDMTSTAAPPQNEDMSSKAREPVFEHRQTAGRNAGPLSQEIVQSRSRSRSLDRNSPRPSGSTKVGDTPKDISAPEDEERLRTLIQIEHRQDHAKDAKDAKDRTSGVEERQNSSISPPKERHSNHRSISPDRRKFMLEDRLDGNTSSRIKKRRREGSDDSEDDRIVRRHSSKRKSEDVRGDVARVSDKRQRRDVHYDEDHRRRIPSGTGNYETSSRSNNSTRVISHYTASLQVIKMLGDLSAGAIDLRLARQKARELNLSEELEAVTRRAMNCIWEGSAAQMLDKAGITEGNDDIVIVPRRWVTQSSALLQQIQREG